MVTILNCMFSTFNLVFLFFGFSIGWCLQLLLGFLLLVDGSVFFIGTILGAKIEKILPFLLIINSTEYTYFDIYYSILKLPLFLSGMLYIISVICRFLYLHFKEEEINDNIHNSKKKIKTK